MAPRDPVALVHEVEMGVDLEDVDRALAVEGLDAGDVDGMVAADDDRERFRGERLPDGMFDIGVASHGVGMNDVRVAHVDDGHIPTEIDLVILVVIGAGMAEGKERGGLPHGPRPEPRARPPLGAEIEGRTDDRDVGLDGIPILDIGALAEGRDADEGQVEASGLVSVGHVLSHRLAVGGSACHCDKMGFGVFMHKSDSVYDDIPAERYQFPRQYLSRAEACVGDWIVYLEPTKVRLSKGYFAAAKVKAIVPDTEKDGLYFALIEPDTYLDFGDPVPFRVDDAVVEAGLVNEGGRISGRAQAAVRPLSPADFNRIIELGLGRAGETLPRLDPEGMGDKPEAYFHDAPVDRKMALGMRPVRDRNFRKVVIRAYHERCAITGLRLVNGGGRAEVEAAHIRPVQFGGPDIVSNGIALSGTVHWMFDRGLLGLGTDGEILVSRQSNDPDAIRGMVNPTGRLLMPKRPSDCPRPEFMAWHRKNCFKQ